MTSNLRSTVLGIGLVLFVLVLPVSLVFVTAADSLIVRVDVSVCVVIGLTVRPPRERRVSGWSRS